MRLSRMSLATLSALAFPAILFGHGPVGQPSGDFLPGKVTAITPLAQDTRQSSPTEAAVAAVIKQYNQGLNDGNLDTVLKTFLPDGVWMAPNQPSIKGQEELRKWYLNYWSRTVAKLQFTPELIQSDGRLAYAVAHVTGTTTPKAGGAPREQDNKTVFVLRQGSDGSWKIAHYILNGSKPVGTARAR
jgi:uncharacterized protein (TIGR02246 family)